MEEANRRSDEEKGNTMGKRKREKLGEEPKQGGRRCLLKKKIKIEKKSYEKGEKQRELMGIEEKTTEK